MSIASTRIQPCLWFDGDLEAAARFYTGIFPNSSIDRLTRMPGGPGQPDRAMVGEFTLDGLTFRAVDGGPGHAVFSEAVSFQITCGDQSEVDYYWDSLVDGGEVDVRLVEGPVRPVVAGGPHPAVRAGGRPRPGAGPGRLPGGAADAADRRRGPRGGGACCQGGAAAG